MLDFFIGFTIGTITGAASVVLIVASVEAKLTLDRRDDDD